MSGQVIQEASAPAPYDREPTGRPWLALDSLYRKYVKHPGTPVFLLVLLVVELALALIYMASRGQDQVALSRSVALVEAVINSQIRDVGKETLDYSYWDDAVARLSETPDRKWADQNIGSYAFDYLDISASFVMPPEGDPTIAFIAGQEVSPGSLLSRVTGGLDQMVAAVRAGDPDDPRYVSGLVAFDGLPYIAAAAAITPEEGGMTREDADRRFVLVFLRAIDQAFLARLGRDFSVAELGLAGPGESADPPAKALHSVDGHYLGLLRWQTDLPGRHLVRKALIPIALAFAAVAVLSFVLLRTMAGTSRDLKESLNLLARRNEELTASERATSNARGRLQSALDYSPEAIAFFDADECLVICNERFRRLMHPEFRHLVTPGQTLQTFCQQYANAWFGGTEDGEGAEWFARLKAINDQRGGTAEIGMACGRWMLVRERRTADGGFVMLFTDITELHGRHKNLSDHSSRLQVTLDTLREGVAVFDPNERLVLWNRRYAEILDLPDVVLRGGTPFDEILPWFVVSQHLDRDEKQRPGPVFTPRCAEDLPHVAEYLTPSQRIVKVRRTPAPDGAMVVTFRDVTDRRKAERELRAAMEQAELANRSKTEFLANVSHELRTPLNAVIGFSEIMMNEMFGPLGEPTYRDYANDIHESGRHLLAIINDLLDLSKVEAGRIELNESVIDIAEVSTSALRLVHERARAAGLTMGIDLPNDLPPVLVDRRAIKQILINLLSNAIKFTESGGSVTLKGRLTPQGELQIAVGDSGIGIAEEDIPTALTPFGQVEGSMLRSTQGTGLGLPLSVALAEAHGGGIEIFSDIGEGTRVIVTLPAQRVLRQAHTA